MFCFLLGPCKSCAVLSRFSHVRLFATPWTVATSSSVPGVLQARILEWVEEGGPPPGYLPNPALKSMSLMSPALADGFFTTSTSWEAKILRFGIQLLRDSKLIPD